MADGNTRRVMQGGIIQFAGHAYQAMPLQEMVGREVVIVIPEQNGDGIGVQLPSGGVFPLDLVLEFPYGREDAIADISDCIERFSDSLGENAILEIIDVLESAGKMAIPGWRVNVRAQKVSC